MFLLTGEVTGKNVTGTVKKTLKILKKRVVNFTFYVVKGKWQAYSTRDEFLVLSKSYLGCILAQPEEVSKEM